MTPCVIEMLDKIIRSLVEWLTGRGLGNLAIGFILFWTYLSLSLLIHEVAGHWMTAKLLGCEAAIGELRQIIGFTMVSCEMFPPAVEKSKLVLIALAGPLVSFLAGLWVWLREHPDAPIRLLALLLFFYSTIPSLIPVVPQSDVAQAINWGLHPVHGWLVFIIITSMIGILVGREITEKRWPYL